MPERPQTLRHCSIKNILSADYGQSARGGHSKSSRPQHKRLQRLYPVEQILCGFHGVLAAKGHPHAAGKYVRQGSGLRFEQGGVHAAQRLAVGGAHLVRDAAEVPVVQFPGGGTRLAGRVQLGGGAYDELVQICLLYTSPSPRD